MTLPLGPVDLAVLAIFLGTAIVVGIVAGGRARTIDAYLLGDRSLPWWVILGSIVATASLPVLIFLGADLGYIAESARWPWIVFALACALFVAWTHRSNLARMRAGTEPRAHRLWLWGRWRA